MNFPQIKMPNWAPQDYMRIFVITALVGMFGFVLIHEMIYSTDQQIKNLLVGALIGSFSTGAIQYLFGTSPQSIAKDRTIAQMASNTHTALLSSPPATDEDDTSRKSS